jgi:hypothetical protein
MGMFAIAIVFLYVTFFPLNRDYPPPPFVGVIAAIFCVGSLRAILQGGCRLDPAAETLLRWWGPLFPVTTTRIPLSLIDAVIVSGGSTSKIDGRSWFSVTIQTSGGRFYRVKALREREATMQFAKTLSEVIESKLVDDTVPEK